MNGIKTDLSDKIYDKLVNLDKGLEALTSEVRDNDKRQEQNQKRLETRQVENQRKLEARLSKLELDTSRQKFARTKVNSRDLAGNQDNISQQDGRRAQDGHNRKTPTKSTGQDSQQVNFQLEDPLHISPNNRMTRASSWAEEVERTIPVVSPSNAEDDRNQWTGTRRTPSSWAAGLNNDVNSAANLAGSSGIRSREDTGNAGLRRNEPSNTPATRKTRRIHECKQDKINKIHHWFGNSSDEESSDSGTEENWNIVDRESRNLAKRKKALDKKHRQKTELAWAQSRTKT